MNVFFQPPDRVQRAEFPTLPYRLRTTCALFGLSGFVLLLPFGRLSELGLLLCLVSSAIYLADRAASRLSEVPALRAALACWTAIFIGSLFSCLDSRDVAGSLSATFGSLRFAALLIAAAQLDRGQRQFLCKFAGAIVGVWCIDALVQAVTGFSVGGSSNADRISGVFGADNLKLGLIVATLAPLALFAAQAFIDETLRGWQRLAFLFAVWSAMAAVVLLGGARAGWIMFAIVSMLWGLLISRYQWRKAGLGLLVAATTAVCLVALLNATNSRFAQRVERTVAILDLQTADFALAGRLPIWQTAARMAVAHPINGVGVRAFRYAYPEFAQPNDPWVRVPDAKSKDNRTMGATHPHQLLLEILTETGLIGLLMWSFSAIIMIGAWRKATSRNRASAWPYACALVVLIFPINTHTALYSSFWAGVLWWLMAMLSASLAAADEALI